MDKFLSNKTILFIGTKYFGYQKEILNSLQKSGAHVDFYYDDPFDYLRIINSQFIQHKVGINFKSAAYNKLRSYILKKIKNKNYDFIFILKGSLITDEFLKIIKQQHSNSVFIQYQWDSIKNYNYTPFLNYYHFTYSFDVEDAANNEQIKYLSMFARDEFYDVKNSRLNNKQDIDILFVGSNHSNRLLTLRKLKEELKKLNLKPAFYVYLPFFIGLKGVFITRKLKKDELMLSSVSTNKLKKLLQRTRYVLDLPSPEQSGTTPRALEALAAGCGLITTNPFIKNESFFNEDYISITDFNNLINISAILLKPLPAQSSPDVSNYSLTNWIKTIFSAALNFKK